jgi:hypothetical protein
MAKTKGPLFSLDASGTIAKTIVYSRWKGRSYVRRHQIPYNPNTEKQINVRKAMSLLVALWQSKDDPVKLLYETEGAKIQLSGFNYFVRRGMNEYVSQITTDVEPLSVQVAGNPPVEVWDWQPVV